MVEYDKSRDELIEEFFVFSRSGLEKPHSPNIFPKVSIFWLNYNSIAFKDIVLSSLESICTIKYPNFELIAIDNCSKDGSYETIRDFLKKSNIDAKLVRLKKNVGFTGGNNVAYRLMDPATKYFVLLNNDAIPFPESIQKLVEAMENDEFLAAAQGIILNYKTGLVDSAGGFVDAMLRSYMAYNGLPHFLLKKPLDISYADGAYSIYRVNAVKYALGYHDRIFNDAAFSYYDDTFLGLRLWNEGFKVKSFPFIAARHLRGQTFSKLRPLNIYLGVRNWIAMVIASNVKIKPLVALLIFKSFITHSLRHIGRPDLIVAYIRAVKDGIKMGYVKRSRGEGIDIYNARILCLTPKKLVLGIISRRFSLKQVKVF